METITHKRCRKCNENKPISEFHKQVGGRGGLRSRCNKCRQPYDLFYYQANKEKKAARWRANYRKNRDRILEREKDRNARLRAETLGIYGSKCTCCGELKTEFLVIDHIDGGGSRDRREGVYHGGNSFYRWLKRNGWPKGYRVLCHNCNQSLGVYGYCPHRNL